MLATLVAGAPAAAEGEDLPFVAVTSIVRDAAVDALYTGMTDALRDAGYREGEEVRLSFENAKADAARAAELVRAFARTNADVIVAFTEPSARIAAAERLRVPLVIAGVGAKAASELRRDRQTRLLTGVFEGERFDAPLQLIREIAPTVEAVAVPVDADNPSDGEALRQMTAFARSIDLDIEPLPVSLENGAIAAAIASYTADKTAILIDRRIFPDAPVERLLAAAEDANLLVFASDEDAVVRGALAAIVADPYGTGLQIGRLVAAILRTPAAARTPLQPAEPAFVVINQDAAARVDIDIPDTVLARRNRIIGWADIRGPRPRGKPPAPEPPPVPPATAVEPSDDNESAEQ